MNRQATFTARLVSLQEVYSLAHNLALKITQSGLCFDLVVAVARGGMLPGRLMCDFLNIDQLTSLQIRHYTQGARQLESADIIDPIRTELKGKSVLLVDDVNDSGKTLDAACKHIALKEPALVRTAVIHEKQNKLFHADFVGHKLPEWKWLMYQWAATEDVLEFLHKDGMLGKSSDEVRSHLQEKYKLEIEEGFIRDILKMRKNYYGKSSVESA